LIIHVLKVKVKMSLNLTKYLAMKTCYTTSTKHHAIKTYRGMEVSGQLHAPASLLPGEKPALAVG
jgi:hypothetical protein